METAKAQNWAVEPQEKTVILEQRIGLEILTDIHVFSPLVHKNVLFFFGTPTARMYT
jgi:hypothetical protein